MTTYLSDEWLSWINENLQRGCTPNSLLEAMINKGINAEYAENAIARSIRNEIDVSNDHSNPQYIYETSRIPPKNTIVLADRIVKVGFNIVQPDIVLINNFLSAQECNALIQYAKKKLAPSTVVNTETGSRQIHEGRTSEGMYFKLGENTLVTRIEHRISALVNLPVENSEGLQILHYQAGAEYRPHYDFFPVHESGSQKHLGHGGQRIATLIMYLNDVDEGGQTVFPTINLSVTPQRGAALYFSYHNSLNQTDEKTLHGGAPVIVGDKWIATKWWRLNKHLA